MNPLVKRTLSAAAVILFFLGAFYFYGLPGVTWLGLAFCSVGIFEYQRIVFHPHGAPTSFQWCFVALSIGLLVAGTFSIPYFRELWGIFIVAFLALALWLLRGRTDNDRLLNLLALSGLGFLYCSMLPSFALGLLVEESGPWWFLFLLTTVFSGDISAYFGGVLFGKKKLMPAVSPKKTYAGSIAGLMGSILGGSIFHWFGLQHVDLTSLMAVSFCAAIFAQNGDLFESLLKRVGSVKDSGRFMPGHGGVLDRIDGVYFAAPVIYAAAQVLS